MTVRIIKSIMYRPGPRGAPGDMDPAEWDEILAQLGTKVDIHVSETEPEDPDAGDLWFDPTTEPVSLARVITVSEDEPPNPMVNDLWVDL